VSNFDLLPGTLNLRFVRGDEVNVAVNLNRDITAHAFESYVYESTITGIGGGIGSLIGIGTTVTAPTIGITALTAGSMVIGLSEVQTNLLTPGQDYRWYLRWIAPGELTRTILSGSVTAVAP
jgi:hypothetical protein